MKVVITGGFGFVGHALTRQFIQAGAEVHIIDNMQKISPEAADLTGWVQHYPIDITDAELMRTCVQQIMPDLCVHLAAMHYIPACNADPVKAHTVNVTGTMHLLDAAEKAHVPHTIIMSSGAIYADSPEPLHEYNSIIAPADIYGLTKWHSEQLTQYYSNRNPSARFTILRLFNVYGPGETNPHIIPEIVNQLRSGNTLQLGNILPKRDFIHVEDVARSMVALAQAGEIPRMAIYNLCSGMAYSMEEVILMIGQLTGRSITVEHDPARWRPSDKLCQAGDPGLFRSQTGYAPQYSMEQGLYELLKKESII